MVNDCIMWGMVDDKGEFVKRDGLYSNKDSLLISHDLMALRGLDETEKWLHTRGKHVKKMKVVIDNTGEYSYFAATVNGVPDIDMIDFGCYHQDKEACRRGVALYLTRHSNDDKSSRFEITDNDNNALNTFIFFSDTTKRKSKKAQKAYDTLIANVEKVFEQHGITIEKIYATEAEK